MDVTVSEVGPRDGLQSIKRTLPTPAKQRWIAALAQAGLREIEVGSFVSPKVLPQMADCAQVLAQALTLPNVRIIVLVPNLRYATMAFEAGTHVITIPVSVSEPHSIANIRKTHVEIVAEVRAIVALRNRRFPGIKVETSLSTAFGCTIQGVVPEADVIRMAAAMADAGSDVINLADTVGYANPAQVKRLFKLVRAEVGERTGGAHLHNTRGQGLANVVAALDVGVTTFDSSQGGIGGCPYAPGATGNIVTEDLVFLLEFDGPRHRHRPRQADCGARNPCRGAAGRGVVRSRAGGRPAQGVHTRGGEGRMNLPLAGVRVVEFSHMVMGPSCGLVLGDLGCDIVKVEPVGEGDNTRRLPGSGAGFFPAFNRNKKSLQLDVKAPKGLAFAKKLIARSDVLIENFRPGGLDALGLGYEALKADNAGLIYCSLKGFLSGPYEHRPALDETVQMMGGLAYMTGPPGRPLRAGASVNDIMGGMFAVIGIMGALMERVRTGRGQKIKSALFENNAFLVSQHMAQFAVTGKAPDPMPARLSSWGIYDVFDTADGNQIFIACVTDTQWRAFCVAFDLPDLLADDTLSTNPKRVAGRDRLLPRLRAVFGKLTRDEIASICEAAAVGYAPITRPEELFDDPQLKRPGAMVEVTLSDGRSMPIPALPLEMDGQRFGKRLDIPRAGEHSAAVASELGFSVEEINTLVKEGVLGVAEVDSEHVSRTRHSRA